MKQNCLGTIRSIYSKLSEKEKKIADYILEQPEAVIHQAINEVAAHLQLADATVFRFSKRLGFKGFQAMKIALASEIMDAGPKAKQEKKAAASPADLLFQAAIASLEKTHEQLDQLSLAKAASMILGAHKVQFFGAGTSAVLALDAFQRFAKAGLPALAFLETQLQLLTAAQLTEHDIAVIISQSGGSSATLALLDCIQKTGAAVIAVTSAPQSPLSLQSDIALYSFAAWADETGMLAMRSAQLVLLDALYAHTVSLLQHTSAGAAKPHPTR
ncbi:MurR/RpiR family transcriptional regulator [Ectobacillus ponti]|uniref:MurR/RpiR family transcriptional regulator n=1 Tax=Ectobacillus ponti TaxID=2961894 RepID=A0AA41X5I1_9BACI|nr:MurR/RpiR family transcriptional regulator [Ectobacillus ponti]MCP8969306.1 MurR/RpiR family transcriptional regulator [Ectobacillus ponti]